MDGILYIKELYVLILLKINSIEKFWSCDSSEAPLHVTLHGLKCSVRAELLAATWKVKFRFRIRRPELLDAAVLCISVFLFCPCAMCDDKKLWLFLNYFAVKFTSKSGHFKHFQGQMDEFYTIQSGTILHRQKTPVGVLRRI